MSQVLGWNPEREQVSTFQVSRANEKTDMSEMCREGKCIMIFQSRNGPSRAAFGDIRFPPNDRGAGEVVTYTMSKEEIRKRYGTPLNEIITKKELYRMRRSGMSNRDIAEKHHVEPEAIKALFQYYSRKNEHPKEEKSLPKSELTKEKYLELKEKKVTDKDIREQYGLHNLQLYNMKKKWGVVGMRVDREHQADKQDDIKEDKTADDLLDALNQLKQENKRLRQALEAVEIPATDHTICQNKIRELTKKNEALKQALKAVL